MTGAAGVSPTANILSSVIGAYSVVVLARAVLDWLPPLDSAALRKATLYAHVLTEPLLAPLRRFVPLLPLRGGMSLDLSPAALIVLLVLLQWLVARLF